VKIFIFCPNGKPLSAILTTAFIRSFSAGQVEQINFEAWDGIVKQGSPVVIVAANIDESHAALCEATMAIDGAKLIVLGAIPVSLCPQLNVQVDSFTDSELSAFTCEDARTNQVAESLAKIVYNSQLDSALMPVINQRACIHYDFMAEWNNLGFGKICADFSIWSVQQKAKIPAENQLASIDVAGENISAYAGFWPINSASLLWFNRPVGPVDSQEWVLIESFIANYETNNGLCLPYILEIPAGYDACVTMRLDCDEDITSAAGLYELYKSLDVPFSLALHAKVLDEDKHHHFLKTVLTNDGSILTHSMTHPVNWGGSYEEALQQVELSIKRIKEYLGDSTRVDYAVSPFHQNPAYAVKAMDDSGLLGFIGGIICNDPEYLIARGGLVPEASEHFISHSQQCMLHGDCVLNNEDPILTFKQTFDVAFSANQLFGYLDHPFSDRYSYGWLSEEQRTECHRDLINYIKEQGDVLFLSQNEAMDWLRLKQAIEISRVSVAQLMIDCHEVSFDKLQPNIMYKGKKHNIAELGVMNLE